ncbi:non-structural protein 2 [African horse sickness virus 6]|uniref:Non-structural protein NS2 n=1 Tax=African horse sickness virus 6 TaxID=86060 RepID=A0A189RLA1_AHSV6|nr:non-structural protein 2 [African horse sickness virus 6]ALL99577.1 non-structural protein 2 [African horse sickness virus 6]
MAEVRKQQQFTRSVCVLDLGQKTYCGKVVRAVNGVYYTIKIGRTVQCGVTPTPIPKSYVLEIRECGAYRIQDGTDVLSLMITEGGIEVTQNRWEEWSFEALTPVPMAVAVNVGRGSFDTEIKYVRGSGAVPPYTKNGMDRRAMPSLPGITTLDVGVRDLRLKMKENREAEREKMERALSGGLDMGSCRMYGGGRNDVREITLDEAGPSRTPRKLSVQSNESRSDDVARRHAELVEMERLRMMKNEPVRTESMWCQSDSDDQSDEDHEIGSTEPENYITEEYTRRLNEVKTKYSKELSSLAMRVPKNEGNCGRPIFSKKCKWENVPIYNYDEASGNYRFVSVGSATHYHCCANDLSYMILPAGGSG